MLKFSV